MRLRYDEQTEAFREELRSWLRDNLPKPEEKTEHSLSSAHLPQWARAWQRRLFDAGWLVPGWPPELGGRNASPVQQMVYFEEFSRLDVPRSFNPQGLSIITPSILDYGSEEQRQRYALPTLRAEITWCLGMSEPNAGSDLAALQTRAELRDDHFVVNGQKVWTSGAHHSDYCFCFVRTDPSAKKHKGISVLIIDMKTPGITCRPLPQITDPEHADFNEVFLDDVVVPRENLIGELNAGWSIAGGSLAHERGMLWIGQVTGLERRVERLVKLGEHASADGGRLGDDARFRDAVASLYLDVQCMKMMGYRGFAKFARGESSPEHSVLKLFASETDQRLALTAMEALGAEGLEVHRWGRRWFDASWPIQYLGAFSNTIAGGTSEIQRNIIAQRVLGLPRG